MVSIRDIDRIMGGLRSLYSPRVFEDRDPYRVLIRTILSQRTRDENTDEATAKLFSEYPSMEDVAYAPVEKLEQLVRKAGFYHVKARRIRRFHGSSLRNTGGGSLMTLMNFLNFQVLVGKPQTAYLYMHSISQRFLVDTHVHRISNRIGLVKTRTPEETERALMEVIPRKYWIELNDLMVQFGQDICRPVGPRHEECPIADECDYYKSLMDERENPDV